MRTGRKCTAKDASVAMQNARIDEDTLRFTAAEYLTETQIRLKTKTNFIASERGTSG